MQTSLVLENAEQSEDAAVATLLPQFRRSDIFVWMPVRKYAGDLRWERVVEQSSVRSVHFHWMLPYPGSRSDEQILQDAKTLERRCLEADLREVRSRMDRVAKNIRGAEIRVRTQTADLVIKIPRDQWFHFGDGDASREKARNARSIRDREIELPSGMFGFVDDNADGRLNQYLFAGGRVTGEPDRALMRAGPDGNRIAMVWFQGLNPFDPQRGLQIEIGSNWETGGKNNTIGMRREIVRVPDATIFVNGREVMRNGEWQWTELP